MAKFNEVILLKYGEIVLKGLNKSYFEGLLLTDIKKRIKKYGEFDVRRAQSTVYVKPEDEKAASNIDSVFGECQKIFGIVSCCRAAAVEKSAHTWGNERSFRVVSAAIFKKLPLVSKRCVENFCQDQNFRRNATSPARISAPLRST